MYVRPKLTCVSFFLFFLLHLSLTVFDYSDRNSRAQSKIMLKQYLNWRRVIVSAQGWDWGPIMGGQVNTLALLLFYSDRNSTRAQSKIMLKKYIVLILKPKTCLSSEMGAIGGTVDS